MRKFARILIASLFSFLCGAQEDPWERHHNAARRALQDNNLDAAETEVRAALRAIGQATNDRRYIRAFITLGEIHYASRKVVESESALRHALESAESAGLLQRIPALSDDLYNALARTVSALGLRDLTSARYRSAAVSLREALALVARMSRPEISQVQPRINQLALALMNEGDYRAAKAVFERGLALREDALLLSNLVELYRRIGRIAEAEPLLNRAITLDASESQPNQAQISSVGFQRLLRLGVLYYDLGQYDVAAAVLTQAKQAGKGPQADAAVNHAQGNAECGRGKFEAANGHYRQALAANREYRRNDFSEERARIVSDMGWCAVQSGDFSAAEGFLQEALAILQKLMRDDHPEVGRVLWRQAMLRNRQKKPAEAEMLLTRALVMIESAAGPDAPVVAAILKDLAAVQTTLGRSGPAHELLGRAAKIPAANSASGTSAGRPSIGPADAAELAYWDSIQARNDPALFRRYIRDFPRGKFSATAGVRGKSIASGQGPCLQSFETVPSDSFAACVWYWEKQGYTPAALAAFQENGKTLFTGEFHKSPPRLVTPLLTADELHEALELHRARGEYPELVNVSRDGGAPRFTLTWAKSEHNAVFSSGPVTDKVNSELLNQQARNMWNTMLVLYDQQGLKYLSVWEQAPPGSDSKSYFDLSPQQADENFFAMRKQGYRPLRFRSYSTATGVRWAEIWIKGSDIPDWYGYHRLSKSRYFALKEVMALKGFSLVDVHVLGETFSAIWHKYGPG